MIPPPRPDQTVAENVSIRMRGIATLKIENGGVRLPGTVLAGGE